MSAKRIALFNHKGGVSKTTTAFNLGWMLASRGKKVLLVDADPQCNLTGLVLGYRGLSELADFYRQFPERNIWAALAPAFESRPSTVQPVDCVPARGRSGLFLLPGNIRLAEYEVTLGIAQELSGSLPTLQSLPGSLSHLLSKTADKMQADYILVDLNPSLSSINQNLLMTSDFFLVPTSPDYFSVMALDSLSAFLPRWARWADAARRSPTLLGATYPFPTTVPKFLGIVIQKYRPRGGKPATGFQVWVDELKRVADAKLVPSLRDVGMLLPEATYSAAMPDPGHCLAEVADFNTLIAKSQQHQTPVFALTPKQIGHGGRILKNTIKARDDFKAVFKEMTDRIESLTV